MCITMCHLGSQALSHSHATSRATSGSRELRVAPVAFTSTLPTPIPACFAPVGGVEVCDKANSKAQSGEHFFATHAERCSMCGLDRSLRSHRARCKRRRGIHFSCPSCRAPFSRRPELVAHMRRVGQGAKMGKVCPSCSLCRQVFIFLSKLPTECRCLRPF